MPPAYDDLPHRRRFLALLALLLLVQLVDVAAAWGTHAAQRATLARVRQARDLDQVSDRAMSALKDAESGQRGYLLTGRPEYLEPYRTAVRDLPGIRAELHALAADVPDAAARVERFDRHVDTKLAEMAETVRLREAGRTAEAMALVQSDAGRKTMGEARDVLADLQRLENEAIVRGREDADGWEAAVRATVAATLVLDAAILGVMVWLWRKADRMRRRYADELLDRYRTLGAALSDRDRLLSVVSHDLRGLLTPVLGYSELLAVEAERGGSPLMKQYARPIATGAVRMNDLLTNLVDWAKQAVGASPLRPAPVPVRDAVRQVADLYADTAAVKRLKVVNGVGEGVTAFVDPPVLLAVLRNLVANAIKYSRDGGTVEVSARHGEPFALLVRDEGVGMPGDVRDRLFTPDRLGPVPGTRGEKGVGLGLFVCQDYVTRSGGRISVESTPGRGTTFFVELPAVAPPPATG